MNKIEIGNKISILRKEKGYTQKQLAEKLHVTDKAVSNWERGNNLPDLSILEPLANELGTTVIELLGLENESNNQIIQEVTKIHIEQKESLVKRIIHNIVMMLVVISSFVLILNIINGFNRDATLVDVNQLDELLKEIYLGIRYQSISESYFILLIIVFLTCMYYFKKIDWYFVIPLTFIGLYSLIQKNGALIWMGDRSTTYFNGTEVEQYWHRFNGQYNTIVIFVSTLLLIQLIITFTRKVLLNKGK